MEWRRHERARCSGCGVHPDEGTDFQPDHDVCSTCADVERYRDAVTDDGKTRPPRGMRIMLLPNATYQARVDAREAAQAASDARWAALENGNGS